MNRRHTTVEALALSVLFISFAVAGFLVLEHAFPGEFQKITGFATSRVYIIPPIPIDCNMTLEPEWNLLSFFCITTAQDIDEVLGNLSNSTIIFTYRAADLKDPWKVYNPNMPVWVVQDLDALSRTEAYWMYFDFLNSTSYFFNGSKRIPTHISLVSGWNFVGYPTNTDRDVALALSSLDNQYAQVLSYNNTADIYTSYTLGSGGTLNQTKAYHGYWVLMNTNKMWVVDW